ncbi:hypothetical protein ACFLTD_00485 [Elusimicrobiota bacterium]
MLEVKGTVITSLPVLIKEKFGEGSFDLWIDALTLPAQEVYTQRIFSSLWYPAKAILHKASKTGA